MVNYDRLAEVARRIRIRIDSPGYGLPRKAVFDYAEWYVREGALWRLHRYAYEYRPEPRPSRLAHHLHGPFGAHRHCVDPRRAGAPHHFEGFEVVLELAHEEFALLALQDRAIDCVGLRPLRASSA